MQKCCKPKVAYCSESVLLAGFLLLLLTVPCRSEVDPLRPKELDPYVGLSGAPTLPDSDPLELLKFHFWEARYTRFFDQKLIYLPDWKDLLSIPPPPANTSLRTRAELDYLLELQKKRTPRNLADIQQELEFGGSYELSRLLGKGWDWKDYPITHRLIINAANDATVIGVLFKKKYERPRPSAVDSRIEPCIANPGHPAYPSGHSIQAHLIALIMKDLYPAAESRLKNVAFRVAWDREVAGVHYPSDSAAGEYLARQIYNALMTKKLFRDNLEKARTEWMHPPPLSENRG